MADKSKTRDDHQPMRMEQPEPLVSGEMKFGLSQFVSYLIDTQPLFTKTAKGLRAGVRIEEALRGLEDGDDYLVLEWRDTKMLQDVAEEPQGGYPLRPDGANRKCLVCVDAVMGAEEVPPEQAKEQPDQPADS